MAPSPPVSDTARDTGTPHWVKVSGIIGGVLVLLVVVMMFTGHGPGRHTSGNGTPPSSIAVGDPAPPAGGP